jgi:isoquinoline 1-oxidoreductase
MDLEEAVCKAVLTDIDYVQWIVFGPDGSVSVFTNRTELGQGLKTVIAAVVTQGLDISLEKLTVVQGDTDCCPDDGPTYGSAATQVVGWGFWRACQKIRSDLVARAAGKLGIPADRLRFTSGGVGIKGKIGKRVSAFELGRGKVVILDIDPKAALAGEQYVDRGIPNVNGEKIVTGELKYVGDLHMPGQLYAGWLTQPYHHRITWLLSAHLEAAEALPGVKMVNVVRGRVAAVGERYTDVIKALSLVETGWSVPKRSKHLPVEDEARLGAKLEEVKEELGDVEAGLEASDLVISETYTTQYIAHAQIETDAAAAVPGDADGRVTVWVSSQYPYEARKIIADYLDKPQSDVRVIAMPVGGGFGGKIDNPVTREAAVLAGLARAPIKLIYSRKNQFQLLSLFKAACIIDVTTGVSADGMMIARKIDSYQDLAEGSTCTYAIPNVLTRAYAADWPFGRAVTRGTSYVQTCFAIESHADMVADRLGMDPFEFRRKNVQYPAFVNLIDKCAEMIGYDGSRSGSDEGIGMAIVKHGGAQLGAVAAKVAVDRGTGKIKVKQVCVAFDIGIVVSRNTAIVGIQGGVAWGIGFALSEEVKLNGHSTETEYLSEYRIPRFSDMPPIEITFLDNHCPPGTVRGCGEMPVIPTIGAIANAVYNAIGIRFYSTPITPEKVKQALGNV